MKIAVVGAGKLGIRITEALVDGDYDITLVDINEEKLNRLAGQYDVLAITGDAKSIDTLMEFDAGTYDFFISTATSDETNILSAAFAKKLGCKRVAARVRDPGHMKQHDFICENFDIDMLINPDLLIASEIYRYLAEKYTLSRGIYTSSKIGLTECDANKLPKLVGKTVAEFRTYMPDMLLVGVSHNGKLSIPHGKDVIKETDLLYILGAKDDIFKLARQVSSRAKKPEMQKVMIIGGGKTGFYLAKRLSEYGAYVKIIEKDRERCNYLSGALNNVMVLNGDGANIALLEEEDLDDMDAFVTATGYDEENLLLALTAKNRGVEDVISKVSHDIYDALVEKLDIDVVLNPLDITCSEILKRIRGRKWVVSSVLLQGQAELVEIYATDKMEMINVPLKDMHLPDNLLVAAVHRGSQTIIPSGDTVIKSGDRVVIVCMLSNIGTVEKLIKPHSRLNILK